MAKHIPLRQCLGCREHMPKRDLVRVVRTPEGELKLDRSGKLSGRGAYLCTKPECFKKAKKARALDRALFILAAVIFVGAAFSVVRGQLAIFLPGGAA